MGPPAGPAFDMPAQLHDPNPALARLIAGVYRDKARECAGSTFPSLIR